jgi:hypothetical protein
MAPSSVTWKMELTRRYDAPFWGCLNPGPGFSVGYALLAWAADFFAGVLAQDADRGAGSRAADREEGAHARGARTG